MTNGLLIVSDGEVPEGKKKKKIEHPYIEPQVQDAEAIEIETKKEDNELFDLQPKFNAIDNAATEQKKNDFIDLVDEVLDENNFFNNKIKKEDIYIEGNLFDDTDSKDIKKVSDGVIEEIILVAILKSHLMMKWP